MLLRSLITDGMSMNLIFESNSSQTFSIYQNSLQQWNKRNLINLFNLQNERKKKQFTDSKDWSSRLSGKKSDLREYLNNSQKPRLWRWIMNCTCDYANCSSEKRANKINSARKFHRFLCIHEPRQTQNIFMQLWRIGFCLRPYLASKFSSNRERCCSIQIYGNFSYWNTNSTVFYPPYSLCEIVKEHFESTMLK